MVIRDIHRVPETQEPQGSDLQVVAPSFPDAVPACGCTGEMCRTSELPPSELATLSGTTRTRGKVTCMFTYFICCMVWCGADIGGEDGENARGEVLVQQVSRQQSGQAAVPLQELLMEPPTQRTSHLLLRQQQC